MADASGSTSYTYDNRDRLVTEATPEGTLTYTYDAHGNVLTLASSNTNGASLTTAILSVWTFRHKLDFKNSRP